MVNASGPQEQALTDAYPSPDWQGQDHNYGKLIKDTLIQAHLNLLLDSKTFEDITSRLEELFCQIIKAQKTDWQTTLEQRQIQAVTESRLVPCKLTGRYCPIQPRGGTQLPCANCQCADFERWDRQINCEQQQAGGQEKTFFNNFAEILNAHVESLNEYAGEPDQRFDCLASQLNTIQET